MKIVISVSQISPGGGLTKYVCSLAKILTDNGDNEIWVLTTHPSKKNPELEGLMKERNIRYISLGEFSKARKYISLISVLREISPDILINNYNASVQYILQFLSRKIKVVHVLHNNTPDFYRVAAINGRYVNRWIAPTPALMDYFNTYTGHKYRDRIVVIPHGVDTPIAEKAKNNPVVQLAFVGVLFEHKGVKVLPDIIRGLLAKKYKFHFTFIGDGILRNELEHDLRDEIRDGIVEFTGRISGEEVYRKLSEIDLFVYPTHIDAFGLVIAEAMINSAVPVVTNLAGITDSLIDDSINGYLIPQDAVEVFVEKISGLIEDETLRSRMSAAAFEKASECFTHQVMKTNYINFIDRLFIQQT